MTRASVRAAALALCVCALGGTRPARAQSPMPTTRFLVMPFEVGATDPRWSWLGEAASMLLSDVLNASGDFAFTREERIAAFEYFKILPNTLVTRATALRLGRALGATDVVVGTVDVEGQTLAVTARRLSLARGRFVSDGRAEGSLDRLAALVQDLAGRARLHLGATTPLDPPPLNALEAYVRGLLSQNPSRQITLFESALAASPRDDRIRQALWATHTGRGQHELALAVIGAVDRSSPHFRVAQFLAALSLVELKRLDEAFSIFTRLTDEKPTGPLFNNLGVLQLRRTLTAYDGRPVYFLTRAAELEPDDPDVLFNLGYAYWVDKNAEAAGYWLREAVRRNPTDGDAHAMLSYVLRSTGASAESDREWQLARLLSDRYADPAARPQTMSGALARLATDIEIPRVQSLSLVLREPEGRDQADVASFHLERGRRLLESAQDAEALLELRKAVYLSPYDAETHQLLARARRRLGQLRQAADALRVSLWCAETFEARVELAEILLELKDEARARPEIARALEMAPDSPRARALQERLAPPRP